MMSKRSLFRRKTYIIKKGLQFRYIIVTFALALLASIVAGYTVYATGWTLLGEKLANVYPQGRLMHVFKTTNIALLRNLLFISPLIFILALLFSHKIAGPLYRIEKTLHDISQGNLTSRIKLRRGDELQGLADIINIMTENLNKGLVSSKEAVIRIKQELGGMEKLISHEPQVKLSLNNLKAEIDKLTLSLDKMHKETA